MGRLVDIDDVVKALDKHTKDESEIVLDEDITVILEKVPTAKPISGREYVEKYGECPICENCPHNCPLDN